MDFEWDKRKRLSNIVKHGIDFIRAKEIWNGQVLDPYSSRLDNGELRHAAIGKAGDDEWLIAEIYTFRGKAATDNQRAESEK